MRYLSVCSGIEAASVAWHPLGWEAAAFSEIEAFPRAVLSHHYPTVPLHGDFTTIRGTEYGPVDLLVGGTPCQSFSVAGLRKGMDDPRGNLALAFLGLADRTRATWVVWENVPGVLSSNGGRDFGAFLGGLAELGYGFAYRVLDAQFFGVPQRRRRVFVVGHLGDWRRAAAVLFERQSLSGDSPPSREAGQAVARALRARANSGHREDSDNFVPEGGLIHAEAVAHAVTCHQAKGGDPTTDNYVAHTLRADGFDASEDGTGRGTPLVPVLPFDTTQITSVGNYSHPKYGDPMHPLAAGAHVPAVAFSCKDHGADAGEVSPTLRSMGHDGSHANGGGQVAVAIQGVYQQDQFVPPDAVAPTLAHSNNHHGGHHQPKVWSGMAVRRITPREAERLQGFPDDYTLVPYRGKPAADGPRYKALGNSMAVPCMAYIGERIAAVNALNLDAESAA